MKISQDERITLLWTGVIALAVYIVTAGALQSAGLHFNYTNSIPVGLYRETDAGDGSYAGFCLSEKTLRSFSQEDMPFIPGDCPGGYAPVLKPVFQATVTQPVVFTQQGFVMDGKLVPNTAPRTRTHSGVVLAHYPFGTYSDGLWAISDFNPNSYDSRYFGPVKEADIRFYVQPLFTHR